MTHIPGIVLFLEITTGFDVRGRGFGFGWQLAAILGLLAHPGRHLIRQAGEHRATYVERAQESWMRYFSLFSSLTPPFGWTFLVLVQPWNRTRLSRSPHGTEVTTNTRSYLVRPRDSATTDCVRHMWSRATRTAQLSRHYCHHGLVRPAGVLGASRSIDYMLYAATSAACFRDINCVTWVREMARGWCLRENARRFSE